MTVLELFKTCTAEEIVEEFGKYIEKLTSVGVSCSSPWVSFDYEHFNGINECPVECEYIDEGGDGFSAGCYLDKNKTCPYCINLVNSSKKQFMDWLNTDISRGMEVE